MMRKKTDTPLEEVHLVVRVHPATGRKELFVNSGHTTCFDGMSTAESEPVLWSLFDHLTPRPEITCRFQWKVDSPTVWAQSLRATLRDE